MPTLRPYQESGLKFLRDNPHAFLADEMGLGKTAQMLLSAEGRTLVITTAMNLDGGTYRDEIAKWVPDRADDFVTAPFTSLNARVNRKVTADLRPEYNQNWNTVIVDEVHCVKGRKTSWTKLVEKVCKRADRVVIATGTPVPHWAQELFIPLRLMWPERVGPNRELNSYWRWADKWFDTTPDEIFLRGERKEVPHVGGILGCTQMCPTRPLDDPCSHYVDFFRGNLEGRFLQRLRDDVLTDLPPLTVEEILCPMTPTQAKQYNGMRKNSLAVMENGSYAVGWSSSATHVMLDKLSTGTTILDPDATLRGSSGKLERLRYDLEQRTRPTLVVAHYKASVEASCGVARELGMSADFIHGGTSRGDRRDIIERFKAGKLDVLVGSLETISEGLTLTAADMVILVETSFKPSRNQQVLRRIHRIGQTRPCTALDYITPGTVDEHKRELLKEKTDHQIRILTAARMAAMY